MKKKPGPGEYKVDISECPKRIDDLPLAIVKFKKRDHKKSPCPCCGHQSFRDKRKTRRLHDFGNLDKGQPVEVEVTYSQHYCSKCCRYFNVDMTDIAPPKSHYSNRVIEASIRSVVEESLSYQSASWKMWQDHKVFIPWATIQNWVEAAGEKKKVA